MKKPILLVTILILIVISLFGVRAAVSNRISTSGIVLGETQDEANKLKIENLVLKEKVYSLSSLTKISSAAAKLGFVESKESFALTKTQPIAFKQ